MRYEETGGRRRRWMLAVVVGAAGVVVGVVVFTDAGSPAAAPRSGSEQTGATSAGPTTASVTGGPSADPVATAQNWLRAYRTMDYRDPSPTSWAQRVAPLLVEPARSQIAQQAAVGTGGASWDRFTAARCDTHVSGIGAVIPPEAPRSPSTVYVQVTGTVVTSCAAGASDQPDEAVSATLELQHDPGQDRWQVARRLY